MSDRCNNILCFLAQHVTVSAIMTDRRAEYGCGPGMLFAGVMAQPVYYRHKKLTADSELDYGHYTLPPKYYPSANAGGNE